MAEKETISSETVLATAGGTKVKPTFVQVAGLWLAGGVGGIIALVTAAVMILMFVHYPSMPAADVLKDAVAAKTQVDQYKELSQIAVKNGQDLFQTIVTQALLPVLTAILGYIFGRSGKGE